MTRQGDSKKLTTTSILLSEVSLGGLAIHQGNEHLSDAFERLGLPPACSTGRPLVRSRDATIEAKTVLKPIYIYLHEKLRVYFFKNNFVCIKVQECRKAPSTSLFHTMHKSALGFYDCKGFAQLHQVFYS